jgi:hypothetical protein
VLIDGHATQLAAVKAEAKRVGAKVTILVDVIHVLEYVWKATRAIIGKTTPEAEDWVGNRFLSLLTGQSGPESTTMTRFMDRGAARRRRRAWR